MTEHFANAKCVDNKLSPTDNVCHRGGWSSTRGAEPPLWEVS